MKCRIFSLTLRFTCSVGLVLNSLTPNSSPCRHLNLSRNSRVCHTSPSSLLRSPRRTRRQVHPPAKNLTQRTELPRRGRRGKTLPHSPRRRRRSLRRAKRREPLLMQRSQFPRQRPLLQKMRIKVPLRIPVASVPLLFMRLCS